MKTCERILAFVKHAYKSSNFKLQMAINNLNCSHKLGELMIYMQVQGNTIPGIPVDFYVKNIGKMGY